MTSTQAMSRFSNIPVVPPDPAFTLVADYLADLFPQKVNLCPGFYRDENAKPWILPAVANAKDYLHEDATLNHEHLPLLGHTGLISAAQQLVFGPNAHENPQISSIQTVSGTGANHIGARFLSDGLEPKQVWISDPSWINHSEIWKGVNPNIKHQYYPYYDDKTHSVNFAAIIQVLQRDSRPGDVVILHGCAHNPTGVDFSKKQWESMADLCEERQLFPFFDLAYQGFASGSISEDAFPVRHFLNRKNVEFAVAQSFSKNFGLYSERVGVLHIVVQAPEAGPNVLGTLARLQRAEITTPPAYGARVVAAILNDDMLYEQWEKDLSHMNSRMRRMRQRLHQELTKRMTPGNWDHILSGIGMFSITGLSRKEVQELKDDYHIYLLPSGRISFTGLTEDNVTFVAEAFHKVAKASVIKKI